MTHNGLLQTFKVYGIALLLDYFILRFLASFCVSLVQTLKERKRNERNLELHLDPNEVEALGQIYEIYKQNYQQFMPLESYDLDDPNISSECDSEENLIKK
mmetsp:Transcript_357/g.395  ORF Transcript_357/g.395 Transcript_357/m.395 type:complete len:101 (+) Transcript_357:1284-1586(+)